MSLSTSDKVKTPGDRQRHIFLCSRHLNSVVAWCRIVPVVEFLSVLQGYLRGSPEMIKHLNPCNNSDPAAFGCPYEEWKQRFSMRYQRTSWLSDVPMRNGNIHNRPVRPGRFLLSDVPMRNGNRERSLATSARRTFRMSL